MTEMGCPCCSGILYDHCCAPYVTGLTRAPTAEALMRSRYSAYVVGNINYISKTMRGDALSHFSYEDSLHWSSQSEWLGLDVISVTEMKETAKVEFKVRYKISGIEKCLPESALFKLVDGAWFYVGNDKFRMTDVVSKSHIKSGRNDPCPCGSGKKYKKCCYHVR